MLFTFPHLGYLHIGLEVALRNVGIEVILPPRPNKETLNRARQLAPEAACLPFSIILGTMIQGLELGADTILMVGGCGPCRVGYFGQLAKEILKENGYKFEIILVEGSSILATLNEIKASRKVSWLKMYDSIALGWKHLVIAEEFDELARMLRPKVEKEHLELNLEKWKKIIYNINDLKEAEIAFLQAKEELINLPKSNVHAKLKIGVVGDIYTMLESFANYYVIEWLGEQGVEVYQELKLSQWYKANIFPWKNLRYTNDLLVKSKPLLTSSVGGFGLESVAHSCEWAMNEEIDGVIQILPMGCMPEIVARSVLTKVNKPFLSLIIDEHDSSTGMHTRLEAFLDMISRQKQELIATKSI